VKIVARLAPLAGAAALVTGGLVAVGLAACDGPGPSAASTAERGDPPFARRDVLDTLQEDLAAERHPADGGGNAKLVSGGEPVAGERGTWELVYEAGPLGIDVGGWLFLQVSPFWGWSTPQVESPDLVGFTEVSTTAPGVTLEPRTLDAQLLGIRIAGRRLEPGESVTLRYGAGQAGAAADRFADARSPFWFAVDGDGDGVRALLPDPPSVRVHAGPAARLILTLPSTGHPGEKVRLTAALLDAAGNAGTEPGAELELDTELEGPKRLAFGPDGLAVTELRIPRAGLFTVEGDAGEGMRSVSNPLVAGDRPRILWADLHGHCGLSDGTGIPEDYYRYARDVAALDIVALTDHDHWGMLPLALHPELWDEIVAAAARFNEPGRLVALVGYEWTNWVFGHRHVLYFGDPTERPEVRSSVDPRFATPPQLWRALEGTPALTVAHHSAGGPVATDWSFEPPPELEPVTEVASVHGASEASDAPGRIYGAIAGNFVRDALDRGYRLGFVGSGDSHDGHPGLAHLVTGLGGVAGIFAEELSRDGVLAALRSRRTYATNGPRIALWTWLDGRPMGSILPVGTAGEVVIEVAGTSVVDRIEGIRSGEVVASFAGDGRSAFRVGWPIAASGRGDYLYVRVVQEDGGAAWSSPYFFGAADETSDVIAMEAQ
jgi:hypothetical protein